MCPTAAWLTLPSPRLKLALDQTSRQLSCTPRVLSAIVRRGCFLGTSQQQSVHALTRNWLALAAWLLIRLSAMQALLSRTSPV